MKTFCKELTGWTLSNNEHLLISYIETYGTNLEEFIDNAAISLEDWHGNEGPNRGLDDLSGTDYAAVIKLFIKEFQK